MSTSPLKGLVLGVESIVNSVDETIIREREVIESPTTADIKAIEITAQILDQCLIATVALAPDAVRTKGVTQPLLKALLRAFRQERFLTRGKWGETYYSLAAALPSFLEKHGFSLSIEAKQRLDPPSYHSYDKKGHRILKSSPFYLNYDQIAKIVKSAGVPVYYISGQRGSDSHYVWVT